MYIVLALLCVSFALLCLVSPASVSFIHKNSSLAKPSGALLIPKSGSQNYSQVYMTVYLCFAEGLGRWYLGMLGVEFTGMWECCGHHLH